MKTFVGIYDIEQFASEERRVPLPGDAGKRASEIYSDLNNKLEEDTDKDVKIVFNLDSVETAIDNILSVMPGERVMRPTFASGLDHYLFEPVNEQTAFSIENEVFRAINEWYPPVKASVNVTPDPENMQYLIAVKYEVEGLGIVGELRRILTFE